MGSLPIIDVSSLVSRGPGSEAVGRKIGSACRDRGFFYVVGHGVDRGLCRQLEELSRIFFAQSRETKLTIRMERGGPAWRGYFPVGAELTSGEPDEKEGLYFGTELGEEDARVAAGLPLHGRNLFPEIPQFRACVLDYMEALTELGHVILRGLSASLGLEPEFFHERYTSDPLVLFRVFNYPSTAPLREGARNVWGVGEHTDYGFLTLLLQDQNGGLQVRSGSGWIDAPPISGSFVCNLGDMLDRLTGGLYRSTLHRVRNVSGQARLSFPFFFDPSFDAAVRPIPGLSDAESKERSPRWDGVDPATLTGTYGEYLLKKVSRVFPGLSLPPRPPTPDEPGGR